jgi:TolB-like protein
MGRPVGAGFRNSAIRSGRGWGMSLAVGSRLGPYEILAPLGAGGMGEVYRARDTRLSREVAIKVLPAAVSSDADRLRRFEQEARSASALNHPNIVTIHDVGTQDGAPYVVWELLDGETLRQRLASGALAVRKVVDYGLQISRGLAAAHEKGIVHRDLKPENLFITRDDRVKILDFGLAKAVTPVSPGIGETAVPTEVPGTEPGIVMGTVGYMSPEQVRGQAVDQRSDVFALGAILYEMASCQRAFHGPSAADTMSAILGREPPELSGSGHAIPPALQRTIRHCLEKSPQARFQAAGDVAFALEEASSSGAVSGGAPAAAESSSGPGRRRLVRVVAGAVVVAGVAVLAARLLRERAGSAAAAGPIRSIAVLPLENFSKDPEQEYFADGMTDELITDLAQIGSLRVISRTSAMTYKGTKKRIPEIGRELDVDAVLEGSVQKSGGRVRITAQLVRASSDQHVWAKSYERDLKDVLGLQSEVARAVAEEVQAALTPAEKKRLANARPVDPEVHELTLRGRYMVFHATSQEEIEKAIGLFEQALRKDPSSAEPYEGLSLAYTSLSDFFLSPAETMPKARAAAEKAIALDDAVAAPHAWLGFVLMAYDWKWAESEKELRRAIALNPGDWAAHEFLGILLGDVGRFDESEAEFQKVVRLDPLSSAVGSDAGWAATLARRYDRAEVWFRRSIELDPSSSGWPRVNFAIALTLQGRPKEAVAEAEKGIASFDSPLARATACSVFALGGQREKAERLFEELMSESKERYVCPYELGNVALALGRRDQAFDLLEKGLRDHSICMQFLKFDPRLDPIRSDARYADLVKSIGFPQ